MNNLEQPFVYVNDTDVESFKAKYINKTVETDDPDKYNKKIVFLGSTGMFATQGKLYGAKEIKTIINTNDDEFLFSDKEGNIAASINSDGINTVAYNIVDRNTGEIIGTIDDENITDILSKSSSSTDSETEIQENKYILNSEDDEFHFADLDGNVVVTINSTGIHSVGYYDENNEEITAHTDTPSTSTAATNRFTDKYVFSICDSLGSGGHWQSTFCEEVGAKPFDKDLNGGAELKAQGLTLSCGGAATLHRVTFGWDGRPDGLTSGQQRAINFVNQSVATYGTKDYLFLQNINDFNFFGDECTDEMIADPSIVDPVMVEETHVYDGQVFDTATAAKNFFTNNLSTVLTGITPSVNRAVVLKYGSKRFSFNIANAATQDGTITITINGEEYVEAVSTGTTVANIAQQLYEINFVGYDNSKADDVLSITANTVASVDYTVSVSETCGCGITVSQTSANGNWSAVFTSHDVNDWNNITKWETNVTSMRAIMGLIEYLEQKLPKTHLIYILMPRFPFKWDVYQKADGTPDEHTYRRLDIVKKFERFLKMQKAVCEYYNLEYIDLAHTMGWNYNNMRTWYGEGTIHWNSYAHEYIGKFLANKLS